MSVRRERGEGGDQYSSISGRETVLSVAVTAHHLGDGCLLSWEYLQSLRTGMPCLCAVTDHQPVKGGTLLWGMWWGKARSQSTFNLRCLSNVRKHNSLCTLLLSSAWNEFNLMPVNITTPLNNFIATQLQFLVVVNLKLVPMQTLLYFVTPASLTVLIAT